MTLLDIAGSGILNQVADYLAIAAKVLLGGLGLAFGGIMLFVLMVASIIGIGVLSITRGLRYRSVPRTVGTFFRWTGVAIAGFTALFILPIIGLIFSVSILKLFIAFVAIVMTGYLVGRTISKLIGLRMRRYAVYVRTADHVHGRIVRIVRGL